MIRFLGISEVTVMRVRRGVLSIALGLLAAVPATAQADFGAEFLPGAPVSTTQAGGHPTLSLKIKFTGSEKVRDFDLNLPPGLVGDPGAVTVKCTASQAASATCPAASKVGSVVAHTIAEVPVLGPTEANAPGSVYVMEPIGDEPARLAMALTPEFSIPLPLPIGLPGIPIGQPIKSSSAIHLRSPGDFGLTTLVRDLPQSADTSLGNLPAKITQLDFTLNATASTPNRPFLTNPTSCGQKAITLSAISYGGSRSADNADPFTTTGCNTVPFTPGLTVSPSTMAAGQPTPISVGVTFPAPGSGTAQSHVRNAVVKLPEGVALSAGVGADGLDGCTGEQFAPSSGAAPTCPALSETGTILFDSPLVGPVTGTVYLGTSTPDAKFRLFAYAKRGQVVIKLEGRVNADPQTGQLTTIFENTPEQPFTAFRLSFKGGDTAALKAPDTCGKHTVTASVTPWAGGANATPSADFQVTGCAPPAFAPNFGADLSTTQAGADTSLRTVISRTDADDRLAGVKVSMPAGLLGRIGSVPQCTLADAQNAACSDASLLGSVVTAAGTGGKVAELGGKVYLTEGIDGSIAGLAIIVPAKVGPIDLGNVVVLGRLTVRPDVGIDLTVDSIPSIIGGVPLYIRSMALTLDRQGFLFNASSCAPKTIDAGFTSLTGMTATGSVPYQATDCDKLAFAPKLTAKVTGNPTRPGFSTRVSGTPGDANLESLKLTLPAALGASLAGLQRTCPEADYRAGACKPDAVIGSARAVSPLIPTPLAGPVTLLKLENETLPALGMQLRGPINLDLVVRNALNKGRLVSSIRGVPDTPISTFDLTLSPNALLESSADALCKGTQTADGSFTAHSGKTVNLKSNVDSSAICGASSIAARATLKGTGKGRTPSLVVRLSGKNAKLRMARITLPSSQLRLVKVKSKTATKGVVGGKTRKLVRSGKGGRTLTVKAPNAKGSSAIEIRLGKKALRKTSKLKPGKKFTLAIRYTQGASTKVVKTIKVRVTARK